MIIKIMLALVLGVIIGIITGLVPGIHVNLAATTMFAFSPFLLKHADPLTLGIFLISMSVTHSFLDTIPSIYLGAPENENALSVLPGHRMLLSGEGYQAVKITIAGTYFGMLAAIALIPVFMLTAKSLFAFLKPYLPYLLAMIIIYMIISDKNRLWAALLFLLSGSLGVAVLGIGWLKEPLFPMLSGLFGVSGILLSIGEKNNMPKQKIDDSINLSKKDLARAVFASSIGVFFIQFFPGMGPAQGAVIASKIVGKIKESLYLTLVGAMGTMSVVFSLVTFYTLGKAKDGSIVVLSKIMEINLGSFFALILAMLIAGGISVFLVLYFAKIFSRLITRIDYMKLAISIILFICIMSVILNGWLGLIILATSTAIGLIAPLTGAARSHGMGCLLLPVMGYLIF